MKKEKKVVDIEEYKAVCYGGLGVLILCFIYFSYEIFSGKGTNPALYSIITIFNSISFFYRGIKLEKNKTLNYITGSIWGVLTILLALSYFEIL